MESRTDFSCRVMVSSYPKHFSANCICGSVRLWPSAGRKPSFSSLLVSSFPRLGEIFCRVSVAARLLATLSRTLVVASFHLSMRGAYFLASWSNRVFSSTQVFWISITF